MAATTEQEILDLDCLSIRNILELIGGLRQTNPRDPLRALEDILLDQVAPRG